VRVLLFRGLCDTGGVSTSMCLHARGLKRLGIDVEFWFCEASVRLPDFQRIGVTHVTPPSALLDAVETNRYDIVHIVTTDPTAELLTLARQAPRIVATNRGGLSDVWQSTNCFARTAVSRGMAELDQPLTDLQVDPIPNSIDSDRFTYAPEPAAGGPIVAWVGRTTSLAQKDFPRFLRVGALLAERGVRLWVADAHGSDWKFFADRGFTRPPIERWERLTQAEMPGFYRAVAASGGALLMTSPTEGFGLAAAEAAACGALVVAPDVVGLRESVLAGITGSLYPLGESDRALADRIDALLPTTAPQRKTAAEAARDEFSSERMTGRYVAVYERPASILRPSGTAAWAPDDPTVPLVLERMKVYTGQRVYLLTTEAIRFAREGRRTLALRAIGRALHASPRWTLRRRPMVRIARALFHAARPGPAATVPVPR
jgi:glycosyltransferase involved in cell wall biosynthesis